MSVGRRGVEYNHALLPLCGVQQQLQGRRSRWFRDDVEARAFGNQVIRDLIGTRAEHYYGWTLDIAEGERALPSMPAN